MLFRRLCCFAFLSALICSSALAQTYLFDHYNVHHGLPSNWVTSIHQDSKGNLWVGGDGGMAVFDGVSFKELGSMHGVTVPHVWSIRESRKSPGTIFAGTHGSGLYIVHEGRIRTVTLSPNQLANTVGALMEDRSGTLWCGTIRGVFRVRNDSASFFPTGTDTGGVGLLYETRRGSILIGVGDSFFEYTSADERLRPLQFGSQSIYPVSAHEEPDGTLWLGTRDGKLLRIRDGKLLHQRQISSVPLFNMASDLEGNLWLTSERGLFKVSRTNFPNGDILLITKESGLQENDIITCTVDREDNLWIGGRSKGLSKLAYRNIIRFRVDDLFPDILNRSVAVTKQGHVFVPATGKLYEYWRQNDGSWQTYTHPLSPIPAARRQDEAGGRFSVDTAPDGTLWVTSAGGGVRGLAVTQRPNQRSQLTPIRTLRPGAELPAGPPLGLVITTDNQMWYNKRMGPLVQVDLNSGAVRDTHTIGGEIVGGTAQAICRMPNGEVWVGKFNGGISILKPNGSKYTIARVLTEADGLASNRVRSIAHRRNGDIWVGTRFNGISIYRNGRFHPLGPEQGLKNRAVWEMMEDEDGRMWVGTSIGVQYTEPDGNKLYTHPRLSGEQVSGIGIIPGKKIIWLISSGSLTFFEYGNERGRIVPPLVSVTGLRINGVDKELTGDHTFSHSENFCVIRFNGISFKDPEGLRFKYRLLGLDTGWHEPTPLRTITFGSLKPGNYRFEVQAITADGTESDAPATLTFSILPPWYLSPWSIGLYVIAGALFVLLYTKLRTRELERRSRELERIVAERTAEVVAQRNRLHEQAEQLRELDVQKSHFFANISHEFRTPLTVILGHLNKLMNADEGNQVKDYSIMERNARRLLHFINQLLDLSKIEAGGMTLRAAKTDIVAFATRAVASLSSYAQHKGISLTFNGASPDAAGHPPVFVYFDHDKIEKVLVNLISNALKFTPNGGSVDVALSSGHVVDGTQSVLISVKDTGTGIPAAKLPYVFDRFYQVEDYTRPGYEGTGIGLALVKELVELHHGSVTVQSVEGKGTTFTVRLPLGTAHLDAGEIVEADDEAPEHDLRVVHDTDTPLPAPRLPEGSDDARVLIVEDNTDLRNFIRDQLSGEFTIIEAANGKEGLQHAEEYMPDIVISDIMMPEMDGYTLCRMIKANEKTNHIPVVLLTAKATTESKLEGLELGADDYLMKPFNTQELQARVRNLIQIRKHLREKFSSQMLLKPSEVTVPSQQRVFLERATAVIEQHLSDEKFSVETLAEELGMSRSQLHRKLKALTNKGPNELIRSFRLQRAAELIRRDAGSLAEIAYQVGFGSQAHFSRSFNEEFGISPSEYKKTTPPSS